MSVPVEDLALSGQTAEGVPDLTGSPTTSSESKPDPERRNAGGTTHYQRILLVEDEVRLRRIVARNLTSRGLSVREAGTAGEAVQAATSDHPDLLLLDINLPDQTGWDVLRELKRRGSEVPTIIVSAVRISQNRLDEFRPVAYLPKPFSIDALLRLVFNGTRGDRPDHVEEE